jgi:hypothetical protein
MSATRRRWPSDRSPSSWSPAAPSSVSFTIEVVDATLDFVTEPFDDAA